MNGIETTNYIRNEMEYPLNAVPIIALTAHNPEMFFEDFEDVGFDELITKPYSVDKIMGEDQQSAWLNTTNCPAQYV